ncbi:hypothetical protein F5X99DRAFT_426515 [Biscogniauxia marginata]|nr:hypothetical protein F5X99DRAFT_426515 [Biscogniauxia marginata]
MASFTSSFNQSAGRSRTAARKEALANQILEDLAQELRRNKAAACFTADQGNDNDIKMMDSDYIDVVESDQTTTPNQSPPTSPAFYPETMDWESLKYPAVMEVDEDSITKAIPTGPRAWKSNSHNNNYNYRRRNVSTASNPRERLNQRPSSKPQNGPAGFLGNHKVTKKTNAIKPPQGPRGPKVNKANKPRKPSWK